MTRLIGALAALALIAFYITAALEHGRRVNLSKARGDQSGYLWDAERVYANWHGQTPPYIIGERNRMPLYAGYLALFYHRGLSDPDYFEVAKRANIGLSLAILAVFAIVFARRLPPHVAANLLLIAAFSYFVFKAGYAQSELLFYGLFFLTFLSCWDLSLSGGASASDLVRAPLAGLAAALAHLTKAAMLPFLAIVDALWLMRATVTWATRRQGAWQRASLAVLFTAVFLLTLWPYLSTSKRVFGHYFYNVNSTFYVWYDDWAHASIGTYSHHDGEGWPDLPTSELPSPGRYWREHTVGQITARFAAGLNDIVVKSYQFFGYLPYVIVFVLAVTAVCLSRWGDVAALLWRQRWLTAFLLVYGVAYLLAVAFYYPTSGTGTGRFFVAHLTPFFFGCSALLASDTVRSMRWTLGGRSFSVAAFHAAVSAMIACDLAFRLWPRLMTTYGGF